MERRRAMAVAAAGAMLTASGVVAGTSGLLHTADVDAASAPSSTTVTTVPLTTTSLEPVVVTEVRDVYDRIVVPTPAAIAAPAPAPAPEPAPATAAPLPVSAAPPPATAPPATPTTTERPDGVPDDWPEDEPIPPMPPGCQKPQLEDDGEWNCDH